MLKLKLQYFGLLMLTTDSMEKSLMLGKIEGRRRRGHQRMRWLDGITDAVNMNLGKPWEMVRDREVWHAVVHGVETVRHNWVTEQQQHMNLREHNSAHKKNTVLESRLDLIIRRTSKLPISDLVNLK